MAIIKKYLCEVFSIEHRVQDIYSLHLKSLNGIFKYSPGQFLHLALDEYDPSAGWPESRCFSMQSSPQEDLIKITYSVRGNYTKRMARELNNGSLVLVKLPYGDLFSQDHSKDTTVFISGGTGITPFLSLFVDPSFELYKLPKLYAGFRNEKMNLYCAELAIAKKVNPKFKITCIYQDCHGILNINRILEESDNTSSFFISGPPIMIKSFISYIIKNGVSETQIKTDNWE